MSHVRSLRILTGMVGLTLILGGACDDTSSGGAGGGTNTTRAGGTTGGTSVGGGSSGGGGSGSGTSSGSGGGDGTGSGGADGSGTTGSGGDTGTGGGTGAGGSTGSGGSTGTATGGSSGGTGTGGSGTSGTGGSGTSGTGGATGGSPDAGVTTGGAGGTTDAAPSSDVAPLMSDGEVLGILAEVDAGEIEQGVLARMRAKTPAVMDFAEMMVKDHTTAATHVASVASSAKIPPASSPLRMKLHEQGMQTTMMLAAILDVPAFEAAYMQAQITMHAMVLEIIDQQLLPVSKDADVKSEVMSHRTAVATHLAHARSLASTDAGTADGGR
jgi:predicted outer membrane protein